MKKPTKIIIVPDSFKGGMSSERYCLVAEQAIHTLLPDVKIIKIPVADGGEGTVDAMLAAAGGKKITTTVSGPFFEPCESFYGMLPDGTAVIEMAAAAGLPLVAGRPDPLAATTFGVGELMRHAVQQGCCRIVLGMGGSATNDAGCGAAAALGVRFYDDKGEQFIPTGGSLSSICRIDRSGLELAVPVTAMCDIDNPLCGSNGAAYVFAPQKGATPEQLPLLDAGLRQFAHVAQHDCHVNLLELPGAGAAGGFGAGAVSLFRANLEMGIEVVLDTVGFDSMLTADSLVITGEGRIDTQSLRGKVVIGVARRAKAHHVPVLAVVGDVGNNIDAAYDMGVSAIFSINRVAVPFAQAVLRSEQDLYATVSDITRMMLAL